MILNLYTRAECPLCDQAASLAMQQQLELKYIDISMDLELLTAFRNIIPVIENPQTGERLNWPFTAEQLVRLADGSRLGESEGSQQ